MKQAVRLDSPRDTQVWVATDGALPELVYWGPRLPDEEDLQALAHASETPVPNGGLDLHERLSWLPEAGRGYTDAPGLALRRDGTRLLTAFGLVEVRVEASAVTWHCVDPVATLTLDLLLQVDPESHVFSASATLGNAGTRPLQVDELASVCLPVPATAAERLHLSGRWSAEFQAVREPLGSATWSLEARTGRSSHHAYPGLVLLEAGTRATAGRAWSAQLAWSGNHSWRLLQTRWGPRLWQIGGLWLAGEIELQPGERFSTPVAHLLRTDSGLRELAMGWHDFVRRHVSPAVSTLATLQNRPVQFSTWEATYFDHDAGRLQALAEAAAELGVERFVMDDGWFRGRHHDRAGLGDWEPCPQRHPEGLAPLAVQVQRLGMRLGLWVEPEGVSPGSALLERNPHWCQRVDGRSPLLGRHQWVLDFGREDVQDWAVDWLDGLLRDAPIDFLKWDMNRDFAHEHGEHGRPVAAAHVRGVHAVMQRLRACHPALEIEACASGGGRADLGMMAQCARLWVSDCNDPLERIAMHGAALQFLPPERLGVHIGPALSHTTGRPTSMRARTLVAWFGHLGIEADPQAFTAEERDLLCTVVAAYRATRSRWYRLRSSRIDTGDPAIQALWAVTDDRTEGWLGLLATGRPQAGCPGRLPLPDLVAGRRYAVRPMPPWWPPRRGVKQGGALDDGAELRLFGRTLAESGLVLPSLWSGDACMLHVSETAMNTGSGADAGTVAHDGRATTFPS